MAQADRALGKVLEMAFQVVLFLCRQPGREAAVQRKKRLHLIVLVALAPDDQAQFRGKVPVKSVRGEGQAAQKIARRSQERSPQLG